MKISTTENNRLEDVVPSWREHFVNSLANSEVERVLQDVAGSLPERVDTRELGQVGRITQVVRDSSVQRIRESILPTCLKWLCDQGHWKSDRADTRAMNEIGGSFQDVAPFEPALPVPTSTINPQAWVLPVAIGSALGPFALLPLMYLLKNSYDLLLYVGGILGAAGSIWLIGLVTSRPSILGGLETSAKWVGFATVPVAIWSGLRGRLIGWGRAGLSALGAWLVLKTVRPQTELPSRDTVLASLKCPVRGLLMHEADSVLARCWTHPDRLGRHDSSGPTCSELPGSVARSLTDLRSLVRNQSSETEDLVDAAEVLLQRFEDVGYKWIELVIGTPYGESLERLFNKYGMIDPGQPVEMLRPALCKKDSAGKPDIVVEPGMIRRVRNKGEA
jgi:hypothetical protein